MAVGGSSVFVLVGFGVNVDVGVAVGGNGVTVGLGVAVGGNGVSVGVVGVAVGGNGVPVIATSAAKTL